jgi:deazaflavin-dependent oxidoreductase (nitroreductase family)
MSKPFFRVFTGIHGFFYRLTGGRIAGKVQGLRVLLLTTTGRKTGKLRTTPLGHFEQAGGYVIIGSNAGSDHHPDWFLNLKGNPHATILVGDNRLHVNAEITGPDKRSQLWAQLIELAPGYAGYATKTNREIPVVILRPMQL